MGREERREGLTAVGDLFVERTTGPSGVTGRWRLRSHGKSRAKRGEPTAETGPAVRREEAVD
jgi:hypothetical protein